MKKAYSFIMVIVFFFFQSTSYAQDQGSGYPAHETAGGSGRVQDSEKEKSDIHEMIPEEVNQPRPGMEIRKIGGINMMLPEGTQFYKEGAQLKMEEASEYSARRFKEMDERLKKIEDKQSKMEEEIKELRQRLDKK